MNSKEINQFYNRERHRALFKMPLQVQDNPAAIKFIDLTGKVIKEDSSIEEGALANLTSPLWSQ